MTHRTRIALLVGIVAVASLATLSETTQLVSWSEDLELSWDLFLGTVPQNVPPNDVAAIHMELKWHTFHEIKRNGSGWVGHSANAIVSNAMNPQLSWARRERVTDAALRHETYHFRLNEAYRKKLEAELLSVQVCGRTVEETRDLLDRQVHQVASEVLGQAESVQQSYEIETEHSLNTAAQYTWEQKIDAWLANPSSAP
ncbi:hypothetical protein ACFLTM_00990 [Candidatus Bipolaricaulota bacterium]